MESIWNPALPLQPPRVAVLAPATESRHSLLELLRPLSREVIPLDTVEGVRRALEDRRPDLLVGTWGPDGETAFALLAEEAVVRDRIPVLVVGGPEGEETLSALLEAGAADHVPAAELGPGALDRSVRLLTALGRRLHQFTVFRTLLEQSRDLVSILYPDGTLAYVSPSLREMLGFQQDEKRGADVLLEVHPEDRPAVDKAFRELLATPGEVRHLRYRVAHGSGGWRHLDTVARSCIDDPDIAGVVVSSWDFTELYQAQEALRTRAAELQERVKEMACLSRVSEILSEPQGDWCSRLDRVVQAIPPGFHFPEATVANLTVELRRHPSRGYREAGEALRVPVEVEGDTVGELEVRLPDRPPELADDEPAFLPEEHHLLRSIALRVGEALWRRRATASLQRSEAYFRTVAERAGVIIGVTDENGRVLYVSEEVRSLLGMEVQQVVGMTTPELVVPEDRQQVLDLLAVSAEDPDRPVEGQLRVATVEGRVRHVEVTIRNLLDEPAVGGLVVTARDVTERVQQERQIKLQADLLDAVGQAVIATDPDGTVIYWNRAAESIYGWAQDEVLGLSILDVVPTEASSTRSSEILADLARGERWSGEIELRRKDGSVFPALVTNAPVFDSDGAMARIIGVSTDLTERKTLDEQLQRAQRLEAVGRLAGGIAHDFNNLLTVIGGHCSLAAGAVEPGSTVRQHLEQVQDAARRASQLTGQLLAFSRRHHVDEKVFDLGQKVGSMEAVLRRLIPERITLDFDLGDGPRWIRADPGLLDQVVLNLVINAKDAIEEEGRIALRVGEEVLSEREAAELPWQAKAGRYATLAVCDTGTGISPELMDLIFEPFFTTKPVGQGTGLGLSMVYGTVKRAGGHVLVESVPGEGATFRILLPRAEVESGEVRERPGSGAAVAEGRAADGTTVLLVEDDPSVRGLSKHVLEQRGFRVLLAGNAREALELLEKRGADVHVVVSDVVMPELGGLSLAVHLRRSHPGIRLVLMSGYPHEELPPTAREAAAAFLEKPFAPQDLVRTVARVLRGG